MKISWLQFLFYAVSLAISLVLNTWQPDMLNVLCTPLPIRRGLDIGNSPVIDHTPSNSQSSDREK